MAVSEQKRILVVEDEGIIATEIQHRLERMGHAVPAIANSGQEALQLTRRNSFDLIFMDIRLRGGMDGVATAKALQQEIDVPVVYLTAHADVETINRAMVTEPYGYIVKPFSDGDLQSAVQISTYKHHMERRLRASEAWLRTTLRNIGDGVLATNPEGEIVFMNPAAEQLTGWPGADAQGRVIDEVLIVYNRASNTRAVNPVLEALSRDDEAGLPPKTYTLMRRDGARTAVELRAFPNRSDCDLLGFIAVLREMPQAPNPTRA